MLQAVEGLLRGQSRSIEEEEQSDGDLHCIVEPLGECPTRREDDGNDDRKNNEDN